MTFEGLNSLGFASVSFSNNRFLLKIDRDQVTLKDEGTHTIKVILSSDSTDQTSSSTMLISIKYKQVEAAEAAATDLASKEEESKIQIEESPDEEEYYYYEEEEVEVPAAPLANSTAPSIGVEEAIAQKKKQAQKVAEKEKLRGAGLVMNKKAGYLFEGVDPIKINLAAKKRK